MLLQLLRPLGSVLAAIALGGLAQGARAFPFETVLHSFSVVADAQDPQSALVAGANGEFYGTTSVGGGPSALCQTRCGTVFRLTPPATGKTAWTVTVLYKFLAQASGPDGANPVAGLLVDKSGALYGTTSRGGTADGGTVFKLTPPVPGKTAWTETVLHRFAGGTTDGAVPKASLIADQSGALYGTTSGGGSTDAGTVFRLTPPATGKSAWTETLLYSFKGGTDGVNPLATLVADKSGALYGTTPHGGKSTCGSACGTGIVFKLTPPAQGLTAWTETVLFTFNNTDGVNPQAGLIIGKNGAFYGTTQGGGRNNGGTVFELTPPGSGQTAWTRSILYNFGYFGPKGDGFSPVAALVTDASGALYGTTPSGGRAGDVGTVFKLTPPAAGQTAWTEATLHFFAYAGTEGSAPVAALVTDTSGALYGTTSAGGPHAGGTAFKLTPPAAGTTAWTETTLCAFQGGMLGAFHPSGALLADQNGALYGATVGSQMQAGGSVFKLTPPTEGQPVWSATTLYDFGSYLPTGSLIADKNGALYGTTTGGGQLGIGMVFRLNPPAAGKKVWTETVLYSFQGMTDGEYPEAGLTADATGALYGTTENGGSSNAGTVFKLTPPASAHAAWTESVIHNFIITDGGSPMTPLLADASGALYGSTCCGGPGSGGTVFKLTPPATGQTAWTETVLYSFTGTGGPSPGGLVAGANGILYGTTNSGGTAGLGTVFSLTPPPKGQTAWTEATLLSFTGTNGAVPRGPLVVDASGALYGTTGNGGLTNAGCTPGCGTLFKLTPPATGQAAWTETVLVNFYGPHGSVPSGPLIADAQGALYGVTEIGGAGGDGAVFGLAP